MEGLGVNKVVPEYDALDISSTTLVTSKFVYTQPRIPKLVPAPV
jgi:hypothetical protein